MDEEIRRPTGTENNVPRGRPVRRRKKRKRIKLDLPPRIVFVFGITAVVVVVVIMSFTLFFNVSQADITGCELYTYDQVLIMSGVSKNTNLLRMNTDIVEKRLVEGLPYIEEAKVTKKFPDSIDIELVEAKQKACLETNGSYMVVSSKGIVLETERKAAVSGLPIIHGFEPVNDIAPGMELKSKDNLKAKIVKTLLSSVEELGLKKISEIDITDRTDIVLKYDNRLDIYIGSSYDMEYKLEEIKAVIDKGLNESFRGMLRYNGTDSGISAIPESSAEKRKAAREAKQNGKDKTEKQEKTTKPAEQTQQPTEEQPAEQAQQGEYQEYYEGEDQQYEDYGGGDAEPAVAEPQEPAVTQAPVQEDLPPETTTWAGW